uniref:Uncharacterized protein n=1 Tax=Timema douglasi TaxID=61478 RepID=A0A7R8V9V8_TIMDO|nr:unnamed protein product [Timema douglasi]
MPVAHAHWEASLLLGVAGGYLLLCGGVEMLLAVGGTPRTIVGTVPDNPLCGPPVNFRYSSGEDVLEVIQQKEYWDASRNRKFIAVSSQFGTTDRPPTDVTTRYVVVPSLNQSLRSRHFKERGCVEKLYTTVGLL